MHAEKTRFRKVDYDLITLLNYIEMGDLALHEYTARVRRHFSDNEWGAFLREHALWEGWEHSDYFSFLGRRRQLMAQIIKTAFESL